MSLELGRFLKELRENAGLSQKDVYEKIGVKQSTYSSWESGRHEPSGSKLLEICRLFELDNVVTMFFGEISDEGNYYLNEGEFELLQDLRSLPEPIFAELVNLVHVMAQHNKFIEDNCYLKPGIPDHSLPVFNLPASAGNGIFLDSDDYELVDFRETVVPHGTNFAVRVSGDSMEPTFKDGEVVFVKQTKSLYPGQVGLFILNSEGYIKELGENNNLISFNEKYPDIVVDEYDDLRIIGRVLGGYSSENESS